MMHSPRRLQKELQELQTSDEYKSCIKNVTTIDDNLLLWKGLLVPDRTSPFADGAFRIEMTFPPEYPFKPPSIQFRSPIYHPNISEKGQVCLDILTNWKPATKAGQVISAVSALLNNPRPDHPLRQDLASEFVGDRNKFLKKARDHTIKFAESRPLD